MEIHAENLAKAFGGVPALDGFSLTVETGTVHGLLGPNGAGKTTAVRVLTTLLRPDSGTARVAGHDVAADPAKVRASIGLLGQHAAVDEVLSGRQNLDMFARLHHLGARAARLR
ncbi:ATP-binding cassette domain-containing protein, partial [Actinocorallia lasiicapitis]